MYFLWITFHYQAGSVITAPWLKIEATGDIELNAAGKITTNGQAPYPSPNDIGQGVDSLTAGHSLNPYLFTVCLLSAFMQVHNT